MGWVGHVVHMQEIRVPIVFCVLECDIEIHGCETLALDRSSWREDVSVGVSENQVASVKDRRANT